MIRILLTSKVPGIATLTGNDLERLGSSGIRKRSILEEGQRLHNKALDSVRANLQQQNLAIRERRIDELQQCDFDNIDAVVSVGGDGTVLATNRHIIDTPIIAVNSDPSRSIGHYTRCNQEGFPALLERYLTGKAIEELIPRLAVHIDNDEHHILNDCLFTNENPAAMTRYQLCFDGQEEMHYSSGVWISTAAGSSAAIHSAGMSHIDPHLDALLFIVREPYRARKSPSLLQATATPPRPLTLTAAIPGIRLYLDGSHFFRPLAPGASATWSSGAHPLRLIT